MMKLSPEEAMDTFLNATTAAILAQLDLVAREALPTISEKDLWRLKKLILGEALDAAIKGGEQ